MKSENRDSYAVSIRVTKAFYDELRSEASERFLSMGGMLKHAYREWKEYDRARSKLGKRKLAAIAEARERRR